MLGQSEKISLSGDQLICLVVENHFESPIFMKVTILGVVCDSFSQSIKFARSFFCTKKLYWMGISKYDVYVRP